MTTKPAVSNEPSVDEPGVLRTLWASVSAVLAKESRGRMRGRRAFVIVTIYLALLALLVFAVYRFMYDRAVVQSSFDGGFVSPEFVSGAVSATIGQAIFTVILVVQTVLTLLLAPALTSGAISIEREKQTLELLITTPVSTLGMVAGKLISSLAYVLILIVASVPLMSIVFAFGGVAPEDVVRAYVLLFAVAIGVGSIGLFVSALFKRTQIATVLSYLIVFMLTIGSLVLHTYFLATSQRITPDGGIEPHAPEIIVLLNPIVAVVDLGCTAIPDSYSVTCSYISTVSGQQFDHANPPRDAFWPRSAFAFLVLGVGLMLATTQLIAASRRIRLRRSRFAT